ncbi:MAG: GNAT family N-acetyltransferase [Anaerolineales bacterium]
MTITLHSAARFPFFVLVDTFNAAYADYYTPIQMEVGTLRGIVERDAIDLEASALAVDGSEAVGLGMLAMEGVNGWIGGLGVIPAYRRHGIGHRLMDHLLDEAIQRGVKHLTLEVIEQNTAARKLYDDLGFEAQRQLHILARPAEQPLPAPETTPYIVQSVAAEAAIDHHPRFHTQASPWQRRYAALRDLQSTMKGWFAQQHGETRAYAVGWGTQHMVRFMDVGMREPDALRALLVHLHACYPQAEGSYFNIDEAMPEYAVMRELGYQVQLRQIEMYKPLRA